MNRRNRGFLSRYTLIASVLVALLLPSVPLAAQTSSSFAQFEEESCAEVQPVILRGQRVPFYQVFEAFLLHASFIYEKRGADAYRTFLLEYGLNPDLQTIQELPWAFDDLQRQADTERQRARLLGEILAGVLSDIERNDSTTVDGGRKFRYELAAQLGSTMSWIFIDESPDFFAIDEAVEHFNHALDSARIDGVVGVASAAKAGVAPGGNRPLRVANRARSAKSASGTQIRLSFLDGHPSDPHEKAWALHSGMIEWRSYAKEDGSRRVVGLISDGSETQGLVDMTFRAGEHLPDFKQEGNNEVFSSVEYFQIEEGMQEKSHLSNACFLTTAVAATACATCQLSKDPYVCGTCALALAAVYEACNDPHCDVSVCDDNCKVACHAYGVCTGDTPADCQCYGSNITSPGCGGGGGGGGDGGSGDGGDGGSGICDAGDVVSAQDCVDTCGGRVDQGSGICWVP